MTEPLYVWDRRGGLRRVSWIRLRISLALSGLRAWGRGLGLLFGVVVHGLGYRLFGLLGAQDRADRHKKRVFRLLAPHVSTRDLYQWAREGRLPEQRAFEMSGDLAAARRRLQSEEPPT